MSLVCIASQGESPGATTSSLLLTGLWPKAKRNKLFVEADPSGGSLASTYQLSLDPSLVSLAQAVDTGAARKRLWRNTQLLPGSVEAIVAPTKSADVEDVLTAHGEQLGVWLSRLRKIDVFADVGQLKSTSSSVEFVSCASLLLMVTRPDLEQLERGAERMRELSGSVPSAGWLLIGDQPYGVKEVEAAFDFPVVGVLADDPQTAIALEQGSSVVHLADAPLVLSASEAAGGVQRVLTEVTPRRRVRLINRSISGQSDSPTEKPSGDVDVEHPPSLVSELSFGEEPATSGPVPTGQEGQADVSTSGVDGSQPSQLDGRPDGDNQLDSNATTQISAFPTDPPPAAEAPSEEVAASATVPPIAATKFWASTTRLAAPSVELSAATLGQKPTGSSDLGSAALSGVSIPVDADDETSGTTSLDDADIAVDGDVTDGSDAGSGDDAGDDSIADSTGVASENGDTGSDGVAYRKSDDGVADYDGIAEAVGRPSTNLATTPLPPTRDMSITEVIETVDTPTGKIDVPPSLIGEKPVETAEVPPSFFSYDPQNDETRSSEHEGSADEFESTEDGGIRPPSLLDAKLSTSANSADELPGYPPLR